MKNAYKWRATNNKYIYICHEDKKNPFIYNKATGEETMFSAITENEYTTVTFSSPAPDDINIKNAVSELIWGEYDNLFQTMETLAQTDKDCKNIKFGDVRDYWNMDGEECREDPPAKPCECYVPHFTIDTVETLEPGDEAWASIDDTPIVDKTGKNIYYKLSLGLPSGKDGEDGGNGAQGQKGVQGNPGRNAKISQVTATATSGETSSVYVSTGGTHEDINLSFDFVLEKGEQGPIGNPGMKGDSGINAVIRYIDASATTVDPDSEAAAYVVSSNTFYDEETHTNITDFGLQFEIPRGEQGLRGETGPAPMVTASTVQIQTYDDERDNETPKGWVYCNEKDIPNDLLGGGTVHDKLYDLSFRFLLPRGIRGETGHAGLQGIPGETDFIYIDPSGGTSGGDESDIYTFGDVIKGDYKDPDNPNVIGHMNVTDNNYVYVILDKDAYAGGGGIELKITGDEVDNVVVY